LHFGVFSGHFVLLSGLCSDIYIYKTNNSLRVDHERARIAILSLTLPLATTQAFAQPGHERTRSQTWQKSSREICARTVTWSATGEPRQANADIPSFHEIANKEGQRPAPSWRTP
jgi:hypothetical protein